MARRASALAILAIAMAGARGARAQGAESPTARADRLFRDGKAALEAGRFDEACPKLAESQHLDPGAGTLLALALCDEGRGHTASAWREFAEVAAESQKNNRTDRLAMANEHQRSLERRLSYLEVDVPAGAHPTVRVDGEELPATSWGKPVPIDPGDHAVDASAPGAGPWHAMIHVGADHDTKVAAVPALAAPPASEATPQPPEPAAPVAGNDGGDSTRTMGWILGGAGVAAIGAGAVFGLLALGAHGDATKLCPSSPCTAPTGVDDENRAKTDAWIADVGIGLGVAAAAVGAYLVFLRPHGAAATTAAVAPSAGTHGGGLVVRATW